MPWWNNIWAQTGAYTPPPPPGITPCLCNDGQGINESPARVVLIE